MLRFYLYFPLILSFLHSYLFLQTIYISNSDQCSTSNCDGSQSNPIPGLINGFITGIENSIKTNDYNLLFQLISSSYSITQSHLERARLSPLIRKYNSTYQLFEKLITANTTDQFNSIKIKPSICSDNFDTECNSFVNIYLKTSNFSLTNTLNTIIHNINWFGNDLPFIHQSLINPDIKNIDLSCLNQTNVNCCQINDLFENTTKNTCLVANLDLTKKLFQTLDDYQFGLFLFKHDFTSLILKKCEFNYFPSVGINSVDSFSFLIGVFVNPNLQKKELINPKFLKNLKLKVWNCKFESNYFNYGSIFLSWVNVNETYFEFTNSTISNYNPYNVIQTESDSYYYYFAINLRNATAIYLNNSIFINCFKGILTDYQTALYFKNNQFIIDEALRPNKKVNFSTAINVISGMDQNDIEFSNNTFNIKLWNLDVKKQNYIISMGSKHKISIMDQKFENYQSVSLLSVINETLLEIKNVIVQNLTSLNYNFITYSYFGSINLLNVEFKNINFNKGNYIALLGNLKITVENITTTNSSNLDTGSFIYCFDSCEVQINNFSGSIINNMKGSFLIYFETNSNLVLNNTNMTNINSSSLGGVIFSDKNNNLNINNCMFFNIFSKEGAVAYIKDNNNLIAQNINTTNCSSDNSIYLGRQKTNNINFYKSYFSYNNATIIQQVELGSINISNCFFFFNENGKERSVLFYGSLNLNIYFINNTVDHVYCNDVAFGSMFAEKNTITLIENTIFTNIYGYTGAILYSSRENNFVINNITMENLTVVNQGLFYFQDQNIVYFKDFYLVNLSCYTNGGVIFPDLNNNVTLFNAIVKSVKTKLFGGFFYVSNNNYLKCTDSYFENLSADVKGGFIYSGSINYIEFTKLKLINITSNIGSIFAIISTSLVKLNDITCNVSKSERYGAILYGFSSNNLIIENSSFYNAESNNLAGGFYLDIQNNLTIFNCTFDHISAIDSSSIFGTVYQNYITVMSSNFTNIILNQTNDGMIGRFGTETNISIYNCIFSDFFDQLPTYLIILDKSNYLTMENNYFKNINLDTESGFIQAGDNNIMFLNNLFFICKKSLIGGTLFYLLTNNFMDMRNVNFNISNFKVFFQSDSNGIAIITKNKFYDLGFTQLFNLNNGSNINASFFNLKLNSQFISLIDSSLTLKHCNIGFDKISIDNVFINLANSKLLLQSSKFKLFNVSNYGLISATQGSSLIFHTSQIIGFNTNSNGGVATADSSQTIQIFKSLFIFNKANSEGGCIYSTFTNGQKNQKIIVKNSIFIHNKAKGPGGIISSSIQIIGLRGQAILDQPINSIDSIMKRNQIKFNVGGEGGAFYLQGLNRLSVENSVFQSNSAFRKGAKKGHGGAIAFYGVNSAYFSNKNSKYIKNHAQIAGALFLSPLSLVYLETNTSFSGNSIDFYGDDKATPVNSIGFKKANTLGISKTIEISDIQSGFTYPYCLVNIIGIDKFGNTAYNTDDEYLNTVKFFESEPDNLTRINKEGSICINQMKRTKIPIKSTIIYQINFTRENQLTDTLKMIMNYRDCQLGEKLTKDYSCEQCPEGRYSLVKDFSSVIDNCRQCLNLEFSCQGGANYTPNAGYWRYSSDSVNFAKCDKAENCLGGFITLNNTQQIDEKYPEIFDSKNKPGDNATSLIGFCAVGYKGILCNECDDNYGKVNRFSCLKCSESGYVLWITFQILFKLIILFVSLHISFKTSVGLYVDDIVEIDIKLTNLIKIMLNHIQMLIVLFTFVDFSQVYFDTISFFLQINSNVSEAINLECLLKKANWNISPLYFQFVVSIVYIIPLLLVCIPYVWVMWRHWCKKYKVDLPFGSLYLSCALILLQLCYFDVMNITLKMFPCFNVADDYNPEYRLRFDYSVRCDDYTQIILKYVFALPVILIFGAAFPLIILGILSHKLHNNTLRSNESLLKFGYFFFVYEEKFFFWDILQLIRKFVMTLIQIMLASTVVVERFAALQVLLLVVFTFLCLQLQLSPYLRPNFNIVNNAERFSLLALNLTFYFSLFYTGLIMTDDLTFPGQVVLFLLAVLFNFWFFVYWGYIFLPQKLKTTWILIKGFTKSCFGKNAKQREIEIKNYVSEEQIKMELDNADDKTIIPSNRTLPKITLKIDGMKDSNANLPVPTIPSTSKFSLFGDDYGSKKDLLSQNEIKSDRKSTLFLGSKKEVLSRKFSFRSENEEMQNDDVAIVSALNLDYIKLDLLFMNIIQFEENGGAVHGKEIEFFAKENYSSLDMRRACLLNEGTLFNNENLQIDYRSKRIDDKMVNRIEISCLKKNPLMKFKEIKLIGAQNIQIISNISEFSNKENEIVQNCELVYTFLFLGFCNLPCFKLDIEDHKGVRESVELKLPLTIAKIIDHKDIENIINYLNDWKTISKVYLFKKLTLDENLISNIEDFKKYYPKILINNDEIYGLLDIYLISGINIYYKIKISRKEIKKVFEPNGTILKLQMKVLIGMTYDSNLNLLNKEDKFLDMIAEVIYVNCFAVFAPYKKKIVKSKLESLLEKDEDTDPENSKFK